MYISVYIYPYAPKLQTAMNRYDDIDV